MMTTMINVEDLDDMALIGEIHDLSIKLSAFLDNGEHDLYDQAHGRYEAVETEMLKRMKK